MRVRVQFFAIVRDRAGTGEATIELRDGATISDAASALTARFPAIADFLGRAAYAVNQAYAAKDTILKDGDELAVIPPVSGG
jgi:molybdopterin synthase catalytic subunit